MRWNDANVVAFGLRLTTEAMAEDLVEAFLATDVGAGEGALIDQLERRATPCER